MTKAKQLQKNTLVLGGIVFALSAVALGIMLLTSSMAESAQTRKTGAENARNADSSQIAAMRGQIEQSGAAEKRFVDIALAHDNPDYSANSDALKDWLRAAKEQYRFANSFKLTLALPKPSDKPELANLTYAVNVREPVKVELGAISDMHVYSFLQQLTLESPGLLRVTRFTVTRRLEMDSGSFRQMLSGLAPEAVSSAIEFTWVGVEPKPAGDAAAAPASAAPTPGAANPMMGIE